MLVLSRKAGEVLRIGDEIRVTVVRLGPRSVRLAIEAPREIAVVREELLPGTTPNTEGGDDVTTS
jgi:carbon storage regulator